MCSRPFAVFLFFKQKTAYELRISDWSSDVCSSDLGPGQLREGRLHRRPDLGRVVLHPAGARVVLGELPVGVPNGTAVLVDGYRPHACRAGVDVDHDGNRAPTLSAALGPLGPGRVVPRVPPAPRADQASEGCCREGSY